MQALQQHRPGWGWHTCDQTPANGRYWVCHDRARIWLPGRLTGVDAFPAFLAATRELIGGDRILTRENITPLRRRHWPGGSHDATGTG